MKKRKFLTLLALLPVLVALAVPAQAALVTLTDSNSTAVIDTASSAGMYSWQVDGISELYQQWFWYRIGSAGPEHSLDTLGPATVVQPLPTFATLTYAGSGLNVVISYNLNGGTLRSGVSDLGEAINITNTSGAPMTLHFFQYSDFDLDGVSGGDSVVITGSNTAHQTSGHGSLSETVTTPPASRVEANYYANTLNSLQDGNPTTLSGATSAGPGDVTWAFQWDVTIANNGTFVISKDKRLNVWVPEPTTILGFGVVLLLVGRKLQKRFTV
jgi:hypothetical protein